MDWWKKPLLLEDTCFEGVVMVVPFWCKKTGIDEVGLTMVVGVFFTFNLSASLTWLSNHLDYVSFIGAAYTPLGPLLLTWFNLNPGMDE